MPLFSIIIPVYNVEKYLNKCVDSVLNQTFADIEVLLVDDGSTDNSPAICDSYAEKDKRVKVMHKENEGVSKARNLGIDHSTGDYIIFLDSDDYWDNNKALESISKKANNKYSLILLTCLDYDILKEIKKMTRGNYDIQLLETSCISDSFHYLLNNNLIPGAPWVFCVKRNLLIRKNIRFLEGIRGEDYDFVLNIITNTPNISAVNDPFYIYVKGRTNSATNIACEQIIIGICKTVDIWWTKAKQIEDLQFQKDLLAYIAYVYSTTIILLGKVRASKRENIIRKIKERKFILEYAQQKKIKAIRIFFNIFGLKLTSKAACKILKLREKIYEKKSTCCSPTA